MVSQRLLLEGEGIRFVRGRIDLRRYRWRVGFRPDLLPELE
jgi:alkylated DNA nucleotide flippase Atl1